MIASTFAIFALMSARSSAPPGAVESTGVMISMIFFAPSMFAWNVIRSVWL